MLSDMEEYEEGMTDTISRSRLEPLNTTSPNWVLVFVK